MFCLKEELRTSSSVKKKIVMFVQRDMKTSNNLQYNNLDVSVQLNIKQAMPENTEFN